MIAVLKQQSKSNLKSKSEKLFNSETKIRNLRLSHVISSKSIKVLISIYLLQHVKCTTLCCASSANGKYRRPFPALLTGSDYVGCFHDDTKGKVIVPVLNGNLYFFAIIDEYIWDMVIYSMKRKLEVSKLPLYLILRFEKQSGHSVKKV